MKPMSSSRHSPTPVCLRGNLCDPDTEQQANMPQMHFGVNSSAWRPASESLRCKVTRPLFLDWYILTYRTPHKPFVRNPWTPWGPKCLQRNRKEPFTELDEEGSGLLICSQFNGILLRVQRGFIFQPQYSHDVLFILRTKLKYQISRKSMICLKNGVDKNV